MSGKVSVVMYQIVSLFLKFFNEANGKNMIDMFFKKKLKIKCVFAIISVLDKRIIPKKSIIEHFVKEMKHHGRIEAWNNSWVQKIDNHWYNFISSNAYIS